MKVILSGGGTGGHIYPALTIADQIKKLCPEADISFVGTQQGLEKDIIPRYGYPLKFIVCAVWASFLKAYTMRGRLLKGNSRTWLLVLAAMFAGPLSSWQQCMVFLAAFRSRTLCRV